MNILLSFFDLWKRGISFCFRHIKIQQASKSMAWQRPVSFSDLRPSGRKSGLGFCLELRPAYSRTRYLLPPQKRRNLPKGTAPRPRPKAS